MRILHLDAGREMRGGQWQAVYLMRAQQSSGLQPLLLARKSGALFSYAREEGIQTASLNLPAVARVSAACEITHCHDAKSHTYAAVAARNRIVVSRRVAFPVKRGALSRWKYSRASQFAAVSTAAADQLRLAGVPDSRITIVPDAVEAPVRHSDLSGPIVALDLADPRKGRALIEAAAPSVPVPIHFTNRLTEALQTARLFVYISESEGLGSAALIAMAAGVPVVASNIGGLREIVHHGETGLLVENESGAIAAALVRLLDDPQLAHTLAENARRMVLERYSLRQLDERTREAYRKALA